MPAEDETQAVATVTQGEAVSSVELKETAKGVVQVTVKSYASNIFMAVDEAWEAYVLTKAKLSGGWEKAYNDMLDADAEVEGDEPELDEGDD